MPELHDFAIVKVVSAHSLRKVAVMMHKVTIELPDDAYDRLSEAAKRIGRTPEEYLLAQARAVTTLRLPEPSEALRKFAGAVCVPDPRGLSNEAIEDDLAREYGDPHKNGG